MTTMSFFTNAQRTTIHYGQFNAVGGNQTNNATVNLSTAHTALQILSQTLADVGAAHNSEARYPPPRCHPETREDVRRRFTDWVRLWKRSWFVYWLYGPAGAGKSAVAQSISEECHASGDLIASYFFSRTHPKRNIPTYVFLTVAYGLARAVPKLQEPIGEVIRTDPDILQSSLEEQFVRLITNPCRWLARHEEWGSRPRLVVIDGLDECDGSLHGLNEYKGSQMQRRILDIIAKSVREPEGLPLHFLICSRPEPAIREFFDTKVFEPTMWYYVLDNDSSAYRDIYIFLRDGLAKLREEAKYRSCNFPPVWPDPNDVHTIVRKSDGQFVYVATILSFVGEELFDPCRRLKVVLGLVPNVDGDSPYRDLDALYHHVLSTNAKQRKTFMSILGFILHFRSIHEDFSLPEIEILLDISEGEAALALRGLHSVLDIRNKKVLIRHTSFTDFLTDESRSGTFFIDPTHFEAMYALCGIRLLNRELGNGRFPSLIYDSFMSMLDANAYVFRSVWRRWHLLCVATRDPAEELLSALGSFDVDAILHVLITCNQGWRTFNPDWPMSSTYTWWAWLIRIGSMIEWLETLPVKHEDLISHFRAAGAGFHISVSDASALNSVLKLVAADFLRFLAMQNSTWYHVFNKLKQEVTPGFEGLAVKVVRATGCLEHSTASGISSAPTECSPGVFFVKPQHIYPSLLAFTFQHNCASEVIRGLLIPCNVDGVRLVGLSLAQVLGPSADLLPLFERELLELMDKYGSEIPVMLTHFILWLKLFPEDYATTTAPLMQLVKKWILDPKFRQRHGLNEFQRLCEVLRLEGRELEAELVVSESER